MVYPVLTKEEMTIESQRYNCFIRSGGNAIPKHADPEAKCTTTGLTLLWARNPFRGTFNHWQVSRKEVGQILETGRGQQVAQLHDRYDDDDEHVEWIISSINHCVASRWLFCLHNTVYSLINGLTCETWLMCNRTFTVVTKHKQLNVSEASCFRLQMKTD